MISELIRAVVSNYFLTFLFIGFIAALLALINKPKPLNAAVIAKAFLSYYLLFAIGINFLCNFVMHVFFADMASKFIGWSPSPFQFEVGFASLGFGILGVIAFRASAGFRAASVIGPAFFYWGAAGGHIYQAVVYHNYAPGNVGVALYADIIVPIVGLLLLWLAARLGDGS